MDDTDERLFHVADAGSFGGGMLSYLEELVSDSVCFVLELLRTRATFSRSRREGLGTAEVMFSGSDGVET